MYARNAASPERIAIGPVVQISDGAVQTSGVSVKVLPQGGTASAGSGTVGYEEGIVHYTPTQAETNYASFIVIAYKSGCIPVSQTIITSRSATTGYAGLDWGQITGATSTVDLSGTTIKTATDVETDTADIQSKIGAPAGASVSADVAAIKSQTAAIETDTQDIQGRLPAALVSGRIDASVGAMAANVLTASAVATDAVTEIQSGLSTLDAAGVRTAVGLASANLDTQIGTLATAAALATVDSNVDAILEDTGTTLPGTLSTIAGYIDTEVAAVKAVTDKIDTALEDDGSAGYQFTTLALENAPGGGGGSDWTADEKTVIRAVLGIPGSGTTPDDPTTGILDTIRDAAVAIKAKTDNLPASPAATGDIPTEGEIADAVWDEALSGHAVSGSTGEALSAAGGSGDPWITALPGSYTSGQAGYILGTYLDAAISSRSTYAGADTAGTTTLLSRLTATRAGYLDNLSGGAVALASSILDAADLRAALGLASANLDTQLSTIDTVVDAVKAKTDSLSFTVAGHVDANITHVNETEVGGTGANGDEWGPV